MWDHDRQGTPRHAKSVRCSPNISQFIAEYFQATAEGEGTCQILAVSLTWRNIGGRPRWRHFTGQSDIEQRAAQKKNPEIQRRSPPIFKWGLFSTFLWRIYTRQGKSPQKGSEEVIAGTHRAEKRVCFYWPNNLITHRTSGRVIRFFPLATGQKLDQA